MQRLSASIDNKKEERKEINKKKKREKLEYKRKKEKRKKENR